MSEIRNAPIDGNNPTINPGDFLHGYKVLKRSRLEEIDSYYYELEHLATGAKHIHVASGDKENTFGLAFKTVPTDSTGVAHILEHTVLCGSRNFPVRDPFFSMLKRSLNTFMNAFTASDWTMYPFSTQNEKDFYNLLDVYLDAVFFPNLDEMSFKQEGHRLEFAGDGGEERLEYKGVVYNEMKGAMSSPDQVMARSLLNALYPTTTYGNNSGGDPAMIPTLTHEELKSFHRDHYHPSNAFFFTYGDRPLEGHLRFIDEKILRGFSRIDPGTVVPPEPRWDSPKVLSYPYPFSKEEDPEKKHQVCTAWLTVGIEDSFTTLSLSLLSQILVGNPASPLRKALMDSGLGTALCDTTGFDADNRDTMFACGLKDVEASKAGEIEKIIFDTLEELADKGIERELIDSAVHQMEFQRKEITNTPYPYGIKILMTIAGTWFHGGDPERLLKFDADLERLKEELAKGGFFEGMLRRYFLDNPHRVLFTLVPDSLMADGEKARSEAELSRILGGMDDSAREKIRKETKALGELQEEVEDLSTLPTLELTDIPPDISTVEPSDAYGDIPATCYEEPTSGIFYFSSVMGVGAVPEHLLPLLPLFSTAFTKVGTGKRDYLETARRISAVTGGIGMTSHARTSFEGNEDCLGFVSFSGKCLGTKRDEMYALIAELLQECDFSDLERLKTVLLEYRAGLEGSVVSNGHRFAACLASRNFSRSCALGEIWHGVHQLKFIKDLTEDLTDEKLSDLGANLSEIARVIITRNNIKLALVGGAQELGGCAAPTRGLLSGLSEGGKEGFTLPSAEPRERTIREGWCTNSAVSFVAGVFKTAYLDHEDAPVLSVISKLLRSKFLHREIREKGGAYGGFASYNFEDGLFSFGSYRDPHIAKTLSVYDRVPEFLARGEYTDEDVKESILQVCSEIDKPSSPGQAARKAYFRKMVSLTDGARKRFKEKLLHVDRQAIIDCGKRYFNFEETKLSVAVVSGKEKLGESNEKLGGDPLELFEV